MKFNVPDYLLYKFLMSCSHCLIVVLVSLDYFSLVQRRRHNRLRAVNLELMAIEQWGFFSVSLLLYTIYCGHEISFQGYLRGPMTFKLVARPLAVEQSRRRPVVVGIQTYNTWRMIYCAIAAVVHLKKLKTLHLNDVEEKSSLLISGL